MKPVEKKVGLRRHLDFASLTLFGVGMILGAGIYSILGKVAGVAGMGVWLSVLTAGVCALLTALSYAELSSMYPKTGAEFIFLKEAFPNLHWLSKSIGFLMIFAGSATASAVSLAFASYLEHFAHIPIIPTAASALIFFSLINLKGIRESTIINTVFTLIEMSGLLLFTYWGFQSPQFGKNLDHFSMRSVLPGGSLIFFAFLGFENIVNLTEEAKNPKVDIPKAILTSLGITGILYLLVCISAVALLEPSKLNQSDAPLMDAIFSVSPRTATTLGIIALFSTSNTILIAILSTSRILYSISREKMNPGLLSRMKASTQTPFAAIFAITAGSIALLFVGDIEISAGLSSLFTMVSFVAVHLALIVLRLRAPEHPRKFKVPGHIGRYPMLPILGIFTTIMLMFQFELRVYLIALISITGICLYEIFQKIKFS